jgi:hypothetical protein
MSLFTLHLGRATPTTRDNVQARLVTFGPDMYDAPSEPGNWKKRWVVVDVTPEGFGDDVAVTANDLAKWHMHVPYWKAISPLVACDHLPLRHPVHREASSFVLSRKDLDDFIAGTYRVRG